MAIDINKRLKYFNTESEYLAYVASQRAAADAGTLDLYETVVCCITHNDPSTPDSYHPSTEPGYADVTFKYNSNDDIRYIGFINPMWTIRKVYLDSTSGVKPVVQTQQLVELPDVIDGQTITKVDPAFTKYVIDWPYFSVKNVTYLRYERSLSGQNHHTLPSYWPSLVTLSVDEYLDKTKIPTFGEDNELTAPNLESIDYTSGTSGAIHGRLKPEDLPVFISSKISTLKVKFHEAVEFDVNSIVPDTSSLTSIYFGAIFEQDAVQSFVIEYDGPGLTIYNIILYPRGRQDGATNLTATGTGGQIAFSGLEFMECDLNLSTISSSLYSSEPLRPTRIEKCYSTAQSLTSFCDGYIQHSASKLVVTDQMNNNKIKTDIIKCNFETVEFNISVGTPGYHYDRWHMDPCAENKYVIINLDYSGSPKNNQNTAIFERRNYGAAIAVDTVTVNLDKGDGQTCLDSFVMAIPTSLLTVNGMLVASSVTIQNVTAVASKIDWYRGMGALFTFTGSNYLKLHHHQVNLTPSADYDVDLSIEPVLYQSSVASENEGKLKCTINNDITRSFSISFTDDPDFVMHQLEVVFGQNVSLATTLMVLDEIAPAFSMNWVTPNLKKLTIWRSVYDAIRLSYPTEFAIINSFTDIYINEIQ